MGLSCALPLIFPDLPDADVSETIATIPQKSDETFRVVFRQIEASTIRVTSPQYAHLEHKGFVWDEQRCLVPLIFFLSPTYGGNTGSLGFSYNHRWLDDSETPLAVRCHPFRYFLISLIRKNQAEIQDGDIIHCVAVFRLTILHPNARAHTLDFL